MPCVIVIESDEKYGPELAKAGKKLVVVDFMATWCGPCRNIAPAYEQFAVKYPNAVLLKVDVEKCPDIAQMNNITAMPTFLLFRNFKKVDTHTGADIAGLELKIKKWYSDETVEGGDTDVGVKGCVDLSSLINKSASECLNESDDHTLAGALTSKAGFLESDCDEQLIISIQFNQAVKLHSLKIQGPTDKGPKNIKVFVNHPSVITFDQASSMEATQMIKLTQDDIKEGSLIPLRFVKFQNIQNLTFFVADNQSEGEVTRIDYIGFIGSTVISGTNMAEFKRVSGKVGESHS